MSSANLRGSAPRGPIRIFLLRASGVRRVVRTDQSQPLPAVLQPFLPSGFAAGDRTGATVAPAIPASSAAKPRRPLPRALSWLAGIFQGPTVAYASFAPQKEEGAGGFRDRSGPPAPFLRFRTPE